MRPTTLIKLSSILRAIPLQNEYFQVQSDTFYEFKADSEDEAKEWVHSINKYRQTTMKIPVIVECPRNRNFNDSLEFVIPYDSRYEYLVNTLIEDIIHVSIRINGNIVRVIYGTRYDL